MKEAREAGFFYFIHTQLKNNADSLGFYSLNPA